MNRRLYTSAIALTLSLAYMPPVAAGKNPGSEALDQDQSGTQKAQPKKRSWFSWKKSTKPEHKPDSASASATKFPSSTSSEDEEDSTSSPDTSGLKTGQHKASDANDEEATHSAQEDQKDDSIPVPPSPLLANLLVENDDERSDLFDAEQPNTTSSTEYLPGKKSPTQNRRGVFDSDSDDDTLLFSTPQKLPPKPELEQKKSSSDEESALVTAADLQDFIDPDIAASAHHQLNLADDQSQSDEDDLEEDLTRLVDPKTWFETLVSISDQRMQELAQLQAERETRAALDKIDQQRIELKGTHGISELQQAIIDNQPAIKASLLQKLRQSRKAIRQTYETKQKRQQLIEEAIASRDADDAERAADAGVTIPNRTGAEEINWFWRYLGYGSHQPSTSLDDANDNSNSNDKDRQTQPEQPEGPIYDEYESQTYVARVSSYLNEETSILDWDHATVQWFWQEGQNPTYSLADWKNPLNQDTDEIIQAADAITIQQTKKFSADDIKQMFADQVRDYLRVDIFVGDWKLHIWDYLEKHPEEAEKLLGHDRFESLAKTRKYYFKVLSLISNRIPGYQWPQGIWEWFTKEGLDKVYRLNDSRYCTGQDRLQDLLRSRTVPENVKLSLRRLTPPILWTDDAWEWFALYGNERIIETVHITCQLFEAMCQQREHGESDAVGLDTSNQSISSLVNPKPQFSKADTIRFTAKTYDLTRAAGTDASQWDLHLVPNWSPNFVKWLLHEGREQVFILGEEGKEESFSLNIDPLFEILVTEYLRDKNPDQLQLDGGWSNWDENTAYWFELNGRNKKFKINDRTHIITPEIHRAFMLERLWHPVILGALNHEYTLADIPVDAIEWFKTACPTGRRLSSPAANSKEHAVKGSTLDELYNRAFHTYVVIDNTPAQKWRKDIWEWLANQWSENAKLPKSGPQEKVLKYFIYGIPLPYRLNQSTFEELQRQRAQIE